MFRSRRTFSDTFRQEAAEKVLRGGTTLRAVAKELDLTEGVLRRWVDKVRAGKSASKQPHRYYTDEFKRKMVEEYKKQGSTHAAKFAASRGFSDASIREWSKDPLYNPDLKPTVATPEPKGNGEIPAKQPTGHEQTDKFVVELVGRLILRVAELDPNFKI